MKIVIKFCHIFLLILFPFQQFPIKKVIWDISLRLSHVNNKGFSKISIQRAVSGIRYKCYIGI